ncbi:MAG TPA: type I restriction enzyme HsdR N-terminal domain-containing protein [Candidatus Saccharimonadales bacterium]|nr:type I restriction enzyme HsdR N-terminal domain-containing protein [Candidatus Saccharimonadales bacterium]
MILSPTDAGITGKLNRYRRFYLNKQLDNLSESSTRILVNHLLTDVLGYKELVDIKIEPHIGGGFADYLVEIMGKQIFVIEVKPLNTKLSPQHLSQALAYALGLGLNWVVITNSNNLVLYRVSYRKPIKVTKLFELELKDNKKGTAKLAWYLSKKAVSKGELEGLWKKHQKFTRYTDYPDMEPSAVTELIT